MPMAHSTKQAKPKKPYADFPLFPHATKRWAKKIRGKLHYFGRWDDPDAALQKYLDEKDDLHAGRTPRSIGDGITVADLCNQFLNSKRSLLKSRELSEKTFQIYFRACSTIVGAFGKNRLVDDIVASDFGKLRSSLAERLGPGSLSLLITCIKMVFKFSFDQELTDRPVRYGQSFNRPSRKVLRENRNKNGELMFEAHQILKIIDTADPVMRAMVLLGINCGFGNTDVASLPENAIDFKNGWVEFPRPKTAVKRRIPLWDETVDALHDAIYARPKPRDLEDSGLCFLTKNGRPFVRISKSGKGSFIDALCDKFTRVLHSLKLKRNRVGFYTLRHTFETIGGESRDQVAVNALMGHVDSSMAGVYRERISDERLKAVTETVRAWLWADVAEVE
jgi:integrase